MQIRRILSLARVSTISRGKRWNGSRNSVHGHLSSRRHITRRISGHGHLTGHWHVSRSRHITGCTPRNRHRRTASIYLYTVQLSFSVHSYIEHALKRYSVLHFRKMRTVKCNLRGRHGPFSDWICICISTKVSTTNLIIKRVAQYVQFERYTTY